MKEPVAVARIVAQFQKSNTEHKLEIRIIQETANFNTRVRKEILLNGIKTSAQKAIGTFPAVLLIPQMTAILEGSPQERRRYLNLTLSQSIPGYAQALTEYNQIISQRNALLKLISERKADPQQLDYWDDLMAKRASFIIYHRIHALLKLEEFAQEAHLRLTANQENYASIINLHTIRQRTQQEMNLPNMSCRIAQIDRIFPQTRLKKDFIIV